MRAAERRAAREVAIRRLARPFQPQNAGGPGRRCRRRGAFAPRSEALAQLHYGGAKKTGQSKA